MFWNMSKNFWPYCLTTGTLNHELENKGMMETVRCVCSEKIETCYIKEVET